MGLSYPKGICFLLLLTSTPVQCYLDPSLCSTTDTYSHGLRHDQLNLTIEKVHNDLQTVKEAYLNQTFAPHCSEWNHTRYRNNPDNSNPCKVHGNMKYEKCTSLVHCPSCTCDVGIISHLTNLSMPPVDKTSRKASKDCMEYIKGGISVLLKYHSEMVEMLEASKTPLLYGVLTNLTDVICVLKEACKDDCLHGIESPTNTEYTGHQLHLQNMMELEHIRKQLQNSLKTDLHRCLQP